MYAWKYICMYVCMYVRICIYALYICMYELNIINNIWIASVKGDVNIRLGATKVSAFRLSRVRAVSCGDRHTLVMTSHKPFRYKDDMTLKPYFKILQVRYVVLVINVPMFFDVFTFWNLQM